MIKVQIKGLEATQRRLKKLSRTTDAAVENGLVKVAGAILNEAQEIVPVVTGRLRSSAFIEKTKRKDRNEIRFGYRAPYALIVHERRTGRGFKWLERAARDALQRVKQSVAREVYAAIAAWRRSR